MATIAIENLESFTTLTDMAKAIGVDLELWTAVKTHMGDPHFEEIPLAATVPASVWQEAILTVSPTAMLKNIKVAALLNAAFTKEKVPVYNFFIRRNNQHLRS